MEYQKFIETVVAEIRKRTGNEKVSFKEKDEKVDMDSIFVVIEKSDQTKFVMRIRARELYQEYLDGNGMEELLEEIVRSVEESRSMAVLDHTKVLEDYKMVQDKLFIRAVNYDRRKNVLESAIYRKVGDIALVL